MTMSRMALISRKFSGEAPEMPWSETVRQLMPWRLEEYRCQLRMLRMKRYLGMSWGEFLRWTRKGDWRSCHKLASMVAREGSGDGVLWKTPLGEFWGRSSDDALVAFETLDDLVYKAYERGPVRLRRGDIVLDCGGHLGTFTRYALNRGARAVVVVEPDPINAAFIRKSFASEISERRVRLVEAALTEQGGEVSFDPSESAGGSVASQRSALTITVKAMTIDEIVQDLPRVDFIKMDIEGAERAALLGAKASIARWKPRMALCIYHLDDDPQVIQKRVLAIHPGYKVLTRARAQAYFYA